MKFSEQWLRSWVNPQLVTAALAEQLTMAGLEVESIEPAAANFNGVIVAEVLTVEPHPNADRLRICQVNTGQGSPVQIVCGASNVRSGLKAPLACLGASLPGITIKPAKLRGVDSSGMLCSATELGLAESAPGLLELPADAPVGKDLREYLQLDDHLITINITPNRGDCLSVVGVAREIAALNQMRLTIPIHNTVSITSSTQLNVKVSAATQCPRYLGRVIEGIDTNMNTPLWMQERLRRGGIRCIHPVVDVTNYVMLELGQPLHAFDLQQLSQEVVVRFARQGETLTLLDGRTITLTEQTLVIADAAKPVALAGVMGGQMSGVTANTTAIFLECAYFTPSSVRQATKAYGINSDAAYRFERHVDSQIQHQAIEWATELLLSIVGGKAGPVTEAVALDALPKMPSINLRRSRIARILGVSLTDEQVTTILTALGMKLETTPEGWQVTVPSHRADLHIEVDLIEELARISGYQGIPTRMPNATLTIGVPSEAKISLERIRTLFVDYGYREIISYSFVSEELQQLIAPELKPLQLVNPISADMAVMRTSLLPGLLKTVIYNQNRQEQRLRLFEIGSVFMPESDKLPRQLTLLAGIVVGSRYPVQWGEKSTSVDFYDVKNDLTALFALTGQAAEFEFRPIFDHPVLHPSKSAAIYFKGHQLGYIGILHPELAAKLSIKGSCCLFEVDLSFIQNGLLPKFKEISKFPGVRRDLAFVVDQTVTVAQLCAKITSATNELLKNVEIFDIYQGKGIDLGKKSVALGLTFQHTSRTLVDQEVNELVQQVIAMLETEFGAKLRD
ncbi:MAG: phenylalanine--tRNA ligase subunit beta [Coxiellaceae bacterium]|nr:MAG: phenylalanine--tRNA ligase subunit beta [Coxiellaceae bacterium]